MGFYVLPRLGIFFQKRIPERKRFEVRALEHLMAVTAHNRNKTGESHVRSTLQFHLVFVAGWSLFECLASPKRLLAKGAEIARTVHQQHGQMNSIPRVRAQTHDAFSLRR